MADNILRPRDFDYIETRLMAPAEQLRDAMDRLRSLGMHQEYNELMEAYKVLQTTTRNVRQRLVRG